MDLNVEVVVGRYVASTRAVMRALQSTSRLHHRPAVAINHKFRLSKSPKFPAHTDDLNAHLTRYPLRSQFVIDVRVEK